MASGNIKGITIELDGDTSGLTQALRKVDGETKNIQTELKQVERLLKLDPSNVELLAQKQKLLSGAIDTTSTRLDALKQAQAQVEQQFKNGEIGEEAYRKFQREIIATEGKLKAFQKQADNVKLKIDAQADTSGIDKMKSALKELGPAAKQAASEIGDALKTGATAGTAAVGALVVGSNDLNNDLARLRTNAQLAGNDLGLVEKAFEQVTAVTGETDSAVETVSNLLATGFKDNQLQTVIEGINGAAIKFSDTLKTEGIADGIQETFATGEAIGMFAELLERSGVDLKEFNAKLAEAKKNGTEADLVMQTMAELGLTSVSDKYKELNPELVKNNESTVQMQTALANLAIVLTPLVTLITNLVTKFVEWATANPVIASTVAIVSAAIAALSGVFAVLGPIISVVSSLWGSLSVAIAEAGGFIAVMSSGLATLKTALVAITGPVGLTIAAIVGIVTALVTAYAKVEWFRDGVNSIFNTIKEYTLQAFGAVKKTITDLISSGVEFAKGILGDFKNFWDENGKFISSIVKLYFGQIKTNIEMVMTAIKSVFQVVWPIISNLVKVVWATIQLTVGNAIKAVLGIIQTVMKVLQGDWKGAWTTIKKTAEGIMKNIIKFFEDIDLKQIGKDIIQGLINGIGSMKDFVIGVIEDTVGSAIDFAKKLLGIASPSRVFKQIGKWTSEGLAIGISEAAPLVQKSLKDLGDMMISVANKNKDDQIKAQKESSKEIAKVVNESADKIKSVEGKAQSDINKIYAEAKKNKRNITKAEQAKIEAIENETANKILKINQDNADKVAKLRQKLANDKIKAEEAANKEYLETVQKFIDDKKSLEQLSLVEEAAIWQKSIDLFTEGSNERIKAQQNYQKAYEALSKEIVSINESYQSQMKAIDDQLIKDIEAQNQRYDSAFESRKNTLFSFVGTFDEFKRDMDVSGAQLLTNLQGQVDGFKTWQDQFAQISGRGINEELLKELSDLGPKALPELMALNSLTDEQLTEYSNLYAEKSKLAREQTEAELIGLKEDVEQNIIDLREIADGQLSTLQTEWQLKIKGVTSVTKSELSTLNQIGVDAGTGLLNGLSSMHGPLVSKAQEIADAIRETIQSALDIHSPSRVMKGFGVNIGQGLIVGMDDMINKVAQSSARLSAAVVGAQASLSSSTMRANSISQPSTVSRTVDNSRHFNPVIHVNGGGSDARAIDRTLRRLAYQI